jgi:hypothetical protein
VGAKQTLQKQQRVTIRKPYETRPPFVDHPLPPRECGCPCLPLPRWLCWPPRRPCRPRMIFCTTLRGRRWVHSGRGVDVGGGGEGRGNLRWCLREQRGRASLPPVSFCRTCGRGGCFRSAQTSTRTLCATMCVGARVFGGGRGQGGREEWGATAPPPSPVAPSRLRSPHTPTPCPMCARRHPPPHSCRLTSAPPSSTRARQVLLGWSSAGEGARRFSLRCPLVFVRVPAAHVCVPANARGSVRACTPVIQPSPCLRFPSCIE